MSKSPKFIRKSSVGLKLSKNAGNNIFEQFFLLVDPLYYTVKNSKVEPDANYILLLVIN